MLLKIVSLDNAVREFSLAWSSWYMSHYTMLCKYGKQTRDFWGVLAGHTRQNVCLLCQKKLSTSVVDECDRRVSP